jgi:predicted nucleic acid-binding protein
MSRIYWDTMLFVYLLEGHAQFGQPAREALEAIARSGHVLCTSVFTVGELLVKPKAVNDIPTYSAIRSFMRGGAIELISFNLETAEEYSAARAHTSIKAADAIHVASAVRARVDFFMTNDSALRKKRHPSFPPMIGLDGKLF